MKRSELTVNATPLLGAGLASPLFHLPAAEKIKDNGRHSLYLKKKWEELSPRGQIVAKKKNNLDER